MKLYFVELEIFSVMFHVKHSFDRRLNNYPLPSIKVSLDFHFTMFHVELRLIRVIKKPI